MENPDCLFLEQQVPYSFFFQNIFARSCPIRISKKHLLRFFKKKTSFLYKTMFRQNTQTIVNFKQLFSKIWKQKCDKKIEATFCYSSIGGFDKTVVTTLWQNRGKIFRKINISYALIRTRTSAYQGVRNVNFSENFGEIAHEKGVTLLKIIFEKWNLKYVENLVLQDRLSSSLDIPLPPFYQ